MNLLLDTCALLAVAGGALPKEAARALQRVPEAYVSVVSPWEVSIKVAAGKLQLQEPPLRWFLGLLERYELREIPLDAATVCGAAALPPLHRDPFDRVIVALARARELAVLTSDDAIRQYPDVKTVW